MHTKKVELATAFSFSNLTNTMHVNLIFRTSILMIVSVRSGMKNPCRF